MLLLRTMVHRYSAIAVSRPRPVKFQVLGFKDSFYMVFHLTPKT